MHWCGREDPYNVIVLDRLSHTLEEVISKCHDMSLIFSYANQMVFPFSVSHNNGHLAHISTLSFCSFLVLNHCTDETTSIETLNLQTL